VMPKEKKDGKKDKAKKADKYKAGKDEMPSEAVDMAHHMAMAQPMMMGMPPGVPPHMAMMMQMRSMAMASRGHVMMRPPVMPGPGMMMQPFMPPQGVPIGRGARSSRPMRGGSFARPPRQELPPGCQESAKSSTSRSSSTSSSSSIAGTPAVAPPSPCMVAGSLVQEPTALLPDTTASAAIDVPVPVPPSVPALAPALEPKTPPDPIPGDAPPLKTPENNAGHQEQDDDEQPHRLRPPPKPGKISFNIQGAKEAMAAAQAQVQALEAVEAVRKRRLNTRDASTQTVRDPERQDGDIVTIWRLRPRGMESFPHFPRPGKKKMSCTAVEDEDDEESFLAVNVKRGQPQKKGRKRSKHSDVECISEGAEPAEVEGGLSPEHPAGMPACVDSADSTMDSATSAAASKPVHVVQQSEGGGGVGPTTSENTCEDEEPSSPISASQEESLQKALAAAFDTLPP